MKRQIPLERHLAFGPECAYRRLDLPDPEPCELHDEGRGIFLFVEEASLTALARAAFEDISFRLPESQLAGFASILADPAASEAERFVAASLIRNAVIAAEGVLPLCQDTGTAAIYGWKGAGLVTAGGDEEALAQGARDAYAACRLRASQLAPTDFLAEHNTGTNLPAMVDLRAVGGNEYRLCFAAKGGGSQNRTSLSMESPALLDETALRARLSALVRGLGASGCPPYRLCMVLGGEGPDEALHVLALAGLGLLDGLPVAPSDHGTEPGLPLRDPRWEDRLVRLAAETGVGAQFGGTRLALDARAIRLSRHAASLPLAFGVSCAAHRRARARITRDGFFLERMEADPGRFLPQNVPVFEKARRVDLDRPMPELACELAALPLGTPLLLSGTVITARDAAHARFRAAIAAGRPLPDYLMRHPVFYAGPTEAAPGSVSGSFGPTTAGRMDSYIETLMERGASLISIAKGGRSAGAAAAIGRLGGAYLAAIGGAAALAAREHVAASEVIDHADLGMEAVRRVVLRELPAILVIGREGRDFYTTLERPTEV